MPTRDRYTLIEFIRNHELYFQPTILQLASIAWLLFGLVCLLSVIMADIKQEKLIYFGFMSVSFLFSYLSHLSDKL